MDELHRRARRRQLGKLRQQDRTADVRAMWWEMKRQCAEVVRRRCGRTGLGVGGADRAR